jgi:hypothetical protein
LFVNLPRRLIIRPRIPWDVLLTHKALIPGRLDVPQGTGETAQRGTVQQRHAGCKEAHGQLRRLLFNSLSGTHNH